ncbi:sugar phosphate isomerase/epimerase [Lewinella sp. W8]|uniref:sugar phosphate isomerase/epimerase family protein n=1 Tax=Lewinella sp. W8 TaxID=2528208 RepID=UPI0020A62638|nr:TIM barrel protein [Lewinella sp. W8]
MIRRTFLKTASLLGAGTLVSANSCSMEETPKFKMGYQLFSVHDDMVKDTLDTLRALKEMGYEDFEIYGFDDQAVSYYGIPATDFRAMLDDLNLTVTSGHYGFSPILMASDDERKRFVDQCISGARVLGAPYITWPWLDPEYRNIESYKILVDRLNLIGEQITAAGLGFAYHNHGFEFEDHNGENGYDLIMRGTESDLVKLQIDMYWVMHSARRTPKELIAEQPGRFVMWHIKDMDKITRDYTELGNGSIDYVEILPDPELAGLEYYYLEQGGNFTHNALRSAADSAAFFQANLQRFL